jgi:hypothetical protein
MARKSSRQMRSFETLVSAFDSMASRISSSVRASSEKPSRAARRVARKIRVGSSMKLLSCSTRTTRDSRSLAPPVGSCIFPSSRSRAMALIEKSRRIRSSFSRPAVTAGSAPGLR